MPYRWTHRYWLHAVLIALAGLTGPASAIANEEEEVRAFRLTESAGLRRFNYPVHAVVPDAGHGRNFRLIRDGKAIPAQFRKSSGPEGKFNVALDFNVSLDPLEVGRYQVQFGPRVEPGPEPKGGLKLNKSEGKFHVGQGSALTYTINPDLEGFLESVGSPRLGYVHPPLSPGLTVQRKGEKPRPLFEKGQTESQVTREGPVAVGLRFVSGKTAEESVVVDLTIPQSKSWVQGEVIVHDPANEVTWLGFNMGFELEGAPTLVDLGAGSMIYGQVAEGQSMELIAGRANGEKAPFQAGQGWVVRQGPATSPKVFAASTTENPRSAEGWAHLMDARRCVAIAVDGFGQKNARDTLTIQGGKSLILRREYAVGDASAAPGPKTLTFWLHFVPMPVQVGAQTSPQAILKPLRVEWDRPQ